ENENFEYDIYARKNGQILIENLNILSGKAFAILKESYISINKLTTNTIGDFTVELDDFSDAIGEGIQLINRDEQVKMNSFVEEEPINQIIQKNSYSNQEYVESEDSKDISDEEFNSFFRIENGDLEDISNEEFNDYNYTQISALDELNNLIGLEQVKEATNQFINVARINKIKKERGIQQHLPSMHSLFVGNPGTGKTTVAKLLAKIFDQLGIISKGHLIETERSEMIGSHIGHTEKNTKRIVEQAIGGVLFVDEAYQLMPKD
ncbi:AAA family ATPase, partial [Staphylococcus aureus]